jgi:hypothetical protein
MKITNNPNEPQRVNIDIVFKTTHIPFTEGHTKELLYNYFRGKGIEFNGEEIVI